jgi:predicted dehydrogenase
MGIFMSSRRNFIKQFPYHTGSLILFNRALSGIFYGPVPIVKEKDERITEKAPRKLGVALVGLGKYSTEQLAPALQQTRYCKLSGIVTGSESKAEKWRIKYDLKEKNIYNYRNFDKIKNNKDIDIVYIVLPNALHAEYAIKAAEAGKHVICEKPMAVSPEECAQMIKASEDAGRMLSIGYRLHFEPYHQEIMRLAHNKVFGDIKSLRAENGMPVPSGTWRTDKSLAGGGPLMDLGIYCVQGSIYACGESPVAVTASEGHKTDPEKFRSVEESISWTMEFPGGAIANCSTSYSSPQNLLQAKTEKGWFELSPAYVYEGIKGRTSQGDLNFIQEYEQVLQMDDFAKCVMQKIPSKVPGEMGKRDVEIISAIYESAKTGNRIRLKI